MTDNSDTESSTWPLPKFRFEVDISPEMKGIAFQEVFGLEADTQVIEYRASNEPLFSTKEMPGITKYGNVTMKRGVFVNDPTFWTWFNQVQMNIIIRQTVFIRLLDEKGNVAMQWQLNNAWPTKITSTDLKSDGNEVAVDALEMAYEQLIITNT